MTSTIGHLVWLALATLLAQTLSLGIGAALVPHGPGPTIVNAVEESILMDGDQCDDWYKDVTSHRIYYAYATDEWCQAYTVSNGGQPILPGGHVYPNVFKSGATYYMTTVADPNVTGPDLYLWASTDKVNWSLQHGGAPILTHNPSASSWYAQVINSSVAVVGDTWHLLLEGKDNLGNNFAIGYAWSTLAEGPNFNLHISPTPVFAGVSGNPYLVYVPDRAQLLAVAGAIPNATWVLRAWSAPVAANLSLAASWTPAPGFGMQTAGVHLTDPYLAFTNSPNKPWRTMLAYHFAQSDGWRAYGAASLTEFFDLVTAWPSLPSLNVVGTSQATVVGVGPFGDAGLSRIAPGIVAVGNGAAGNATGTLQAAAFAGRVQLPDGSAGVPAAFWPSLFATGLYRDGSSVGVACGGLACASLGISGTVARGFGIWGSTSAIPGGVNLSATGDLQFGGQAALRGAAVTVAAGFGAGAVPLDGARHWSFSIDVGTSPATSGVLTLPAAAHRWVCALSTPTDRVTASTTTSITITTSVGWAAHDLVSGSCFPH